LQGHGPGPDVGPGRVAGLVASAWTWTHDGHCQGHGTLPASSPCRRPIACPLERGPPFRGGFHARNGNRPCEASERSPATVVFGILTAAVVRLLLERFTSLGLLGRGS